MKRKPTSKSEKAPFENSAEARRRAQKIRGRGGLVAIDLESGAIRVAQADFNGTRARIQRFGTMALDHAIEWGRTDSKQVGASVASALGSLKAKAGQALFVLPRSQVVLRPLSVPFTPDLGELSAMVNLQMAKDLPFKIDEAVIDFKVLRVFDAASPVPESTEAASPDRGSADKDKEKDKAADAAQISGTDNRRVEVMVGAVRRETCAYCQSVAEAAGLKLVGLLLRSHAGTRVLVRTLPPADDGACALIMLRRDEITIDLVVGQMLVFSRLALVRMPEVTPSATSAASDSETTEANTAQSKATDVAGTSANTAPTPTPIPVAVAVAVPVPATPNFVGVSAEDEARFLAALGTEILRSSASYDGMLWRKPLRSIHVAGDTGWEERVVEYLGVKTGLPTSRLHPDEALLGRGAGKPESAQGALSAIGATLYYEEPAGPPLEFLHPKRPPVRRDLRRIRIIGGMVAAMTLILALFATRKHLVDKRVIVRNGLQTQVTEAEKKLPTYRRLQSQARVVRSWMEDGRGWLDHLMILNSALPAAEDLYVTSFATTSQGLIRMSVQARSSDLLVDLDKRLRAAGYDVRPLSITPGNDKHGYPFRTTVELGIPRSMKVNLEGIQIPKRPEDDTPVPISAPVARNP